MADFPSAETLRRLELPEPLAGVAASDALQLGAAEHGYLALSLAPTPRLFGIDAALAEVTELDLQSTEAGEWLLAPAGEALAHSIPGRGVTVYRRADGGWLPAVALTDSARFVARGVYAGGRLAVDVEATTLDGSTRLQIVVADGVETRTLSPLAPMRRPPRSPPAPSGRWARRAPGPWCSPGSGGERSTASKRSGAPLALEPLQRT